jgi:hypothetical protein
MSYPAIQLINRAWVLSGIVGKNLQNTQGNQASDGLFLLNELLEFKAIDVNLIPYFKHVELTLNANQETYFVSNLVFLESMTFNIGSVRYSMQKTLRQEYWGTSKALDIQSLPFQYHFERVKGGANVYVYFTPNQQYVSNLTGKFGLTDVSLQTDLSLTYDGAYISYLRYELANFMCNEYGVPFPERHERTLISMRNMLNNQSPPDLSMKKSSTLSNNYGINYGVVNICNGWLPSGSR